MPYISLTNRGALDCILEGVIKILRPFGIGAREEVRQAIANLVVYTQVSDANFDQVHEDLDSNVLLIVRDLGKRLLSLRCVRGDLNYCVTRIVLESLRPEKGWSYHSLSDAVSACNLAADKVIEIYGVDEVGAQDSISILRDVADEIKRRLLGPYEDKAIRKNGDMLCFAQEDFAYCPPLDPNAYQSGPIPQLQVPDLNMSQLASYVDHPQSPEAEQARLDALAEEDLAKARSAAFSDDMFNSHDMFSDMIPPLGCSGLAFDPVTGTHYDPKTCEPCPPPSAEPQVTPLPDIREALTQQQLDSINEERQQDEG